ncbi:hypothetical protein JKP88DRAFT_286940 [Tribonema minus]|uniref:histone acetyltransferase n=1 Tax=Tribonema minus TaxID=303371 RepID=A0A836CK84_9STRA|nr:hypothetical protein JKP88DRAFT_286940 [Tribonema minus]
MAAPAQPWQHRHYSVQRLHRGDLASFIKERVDNRLQELEMQQPAGYIIFAVVPINETVYYHVPPLVCERCAVSTADQSQAPPPETIPYTNKCTCIHQVQEGQAVLFMVLCCREHGASACNAGRVYLSYLDTVALAKPAEARTTIYQEVVAAYMDWVRRRGFRFVHLWSWPSAEGDEYILVRSADALPYAQFMYAAITSW